MENQKIKYICKVYFDKDHYKKFTLIDSISDSLYELTKWATKFGAIKVELTICENYKNKKEKKNEILQNSKKT